MSKSSVFNKVLDNSMLHKLQNIFWWRFAVNQVKVNLPWWNIIKKLKQVQSPTILHFMHIYLYTLYIQIYMNTQCIFWICVRVYVSSRNKMVMSTNTGCSCLELGSATPHPASPVLHWLRIWSTQQVQQLSPRGCGGDRSLWSQISRYYASLSPIMLISFSCGQTLARSSLKRRFAWLLFWLSPSPGWSKRRGWIFGRCRWLWWSQSPPLSTQNTCFLLQRWCQNFCHRQYVCQE